MVDVKISALPQATLTTPADLAPLDRSGTSMQATLAVLQNSVGVYSGSGVPTVSVPNGSLFLRSDGAGGTTLYVRAQGAWTPIKQVPISGSFYDIGVWELSPPSFDIGVWEGVATGTSPTAPFVPFFMGAPSNTSIANATVRGSTAGFSARFKVQQSGNIVSVRWYNIVDPPNYSGGTGGIASITIQGNTFPASYAGTPYGIPDGNVLGGAGTLSNTSSFPTYNTTTLSTPAPVVAGNIYHCVFRNTDASPSVNFYSVDMPWTEWENYGAVNSEPYPKSSPPFPNSPHLPMDWNGGLMMDFPTAGVWNDRQFTYNLQFTFADGHHEGFPYMECWGRSEAPASNSGLIDSTNMVRQLFTPRIDLKATEFALRYARTQASTGTNPMICRIETQAGAFVDQLSFTSAESNVEPAPDYTTTSTDGLNVCPYHRWVIKTFTQQPTIFTAGVAYRFTLSSTSPTQYRAYPMEAGITGLTSWGFDPLLRMTGPGAAAVYSTNGGATWSTGWKSAGSDNRPESDLQFSMKLIP